MARQCWLSRVTANTTVLPFDITATQGRRYVAASQVAADHDAARLLQHRRVKRYARLSYKRQVPARVKTRYAATKRGVAVTKENGVRCRRRDNPAQRYTSTVECC